MYKFKEKLFNPAAAVGLLGKIGGALSKATPDTLINGGLGLLGTGTSIAGMVQGSKQAAAAEKQADKQMEEQRRLQNQQIKAQAKQNQQMMNTLKQVAKQNPTVAGAAAGMMQQQFSVPAKLAQAAKSGKGLLKDVLVVGKKMGGSNRIAQGIAMGTTMAAGNYLVDKAIQADAKRSGIDLGETEDDRKKHGKKLAIAAGVATAAGLSALGAKKGYLGKNLQEKASKYLTKDNFKKAGKLTKDAFKDQFVDAEKWKAANSMKDKAKAVRAGGLALTGAFVASPAIQYAMNKKSLKDQIEQTEEGASQKNYSKFSVPNGLKTFVSTKVKPAVQRLGYRRNAVNSKSVASFKEAPVRNVLGKISSFWGGGGQEGTSEFTKKLAAQGRLSGNKSTAKVADFLDKHKTLAVGGSLVVGNMLMKPYELGSKAVSTTLGAVDKNAMKFEKSQNKQVEEE